MLAEAKHSNAHGEALLNGTSAAHGVDGSTDDGGSSEASAEHPQQLAGAKRKKPKAPKVKKPTPASAAAALQLGDVASVSKLVHSSKAPLSTSRTRHNAQSLSFYCTR